MDIDDIICKAVAEIKKTAKFRDPPYELPADSFIEEACSNIVKTTLQAVGLYPKEKCEEAYMVEGGRFRQLLLGCKGFKEECFKCRYFDMNKFMGYSCYERGSCPATSLHPDVIARILKAVKP